MNGTDLYFLDEALDYLNETSLCDISYLLEFSVKDTVKDMIKKVKAAIVKLIKGIQKALSKCKDSKVKTGLNNLLNKAKDLLDDTKNAATKEDAEKAAKACKTIHGQLKSHIAKDGVIDLDPDEYEILSA